MGLNTAIEAAIFTRFGGWFTFAAFSFLPAVLWAGVAAYALASSDRAAAHRQLPSDRAARSLSQWACRGLAAIVAFPVVYFFFGTPVGLLVGDYYRREMFGLTLPSLHVIILVQFLRGALFLLAALPVLLVWTGSQLRFVLIFGLAHFVVTGLFGMVQATWLAGFIRVSPIVFDYRETAAAAATPAMFAKNESQYRRKSVAVLGLARRR